MRNSSQNKRLDRIPRQFRDLVEADLLALAQKIKRKRRLKKLTQEELAGLLEVDPTTVQSIEQARGRPSIELLMTIVKVLEMKITLQ